MEIEERNEFVADNPSDARNVVIETTASFNSAAEEDQEFEGVKAAVRIGTNACFQVYTTNLNGRVWLDTEGFTATVGIDYTVRVEMDMTNRMYSYSDGNHTDLNSFRLRADVDLALPLSFGRTFDYDALIKYRDFTGLKYNRPSLGAEGLEQTKDSSEVWIFPQSGTKYHQESCTYVKATVHSCILTNTLKHQYSACGMCACA